MKIDNIKNKILQLAIQGKLVPQDKNDDSVSELINEIHKEKEQLIKEKKIKQEKLLPEISEEEKMFVIPDTWKWCRLGDLCYFQKGYAFKSKDYIDEGIMVTRVSNLNNPGSKDVVYLDYDEAKKFEQYRLYNGDVVLTTVGSWPTAPTSVVGNAIYIEDEFDNTLLNQNAVRLRSIIEQKYLYIVIKSKVFKKYIEDIAQGTANQASITQEGIKLFKVPLPPLQEQKRIVSKVSELFAIVDTLNENKDGMAKAIADTRNKVLQLAIQGKLEKQYKNDEPASIVLKRIREQKEQLIKEKKIKKEKSLPEISEEEKSFEVPDGWEWCRLGDISAPELYSFVDGPFGSNLKREHYVDKGIRIIQLQNVGEGFWKDGNKIYTSDEKADELIRCNAFPGELVIAKMNPIARTAIIPDNDKRYVLCSDCVKLKPEKSIDIFYIKYLMNSQYIKSRATEDGTGTTRQRTSLGKLKSMPIPLPPIEEQKRIVKKVDEIMNYLDSLEKTLLV